MFSESTQGNQDVIVEAVKKEINKSISSLKPEAFCSSKEQICVQGPPGIPGSKGSRGKRGPRGSTGRKGSRGFTGDPGPHGKQGIQIGTGLAISGISQMVDLRFVAFVS